MLLVEMWSSWHRQPRKGQLGPRCWQVPRYPGTCGHIGMGQGVQHWTVMLGVLWLPNISLVPDYSLLSLYSSVWSFPFKDSLMQLFLFLIPLLLFLKFSFPHFLFQQMSCPCFLSHSALDCWALDLCKHTHMVICSLAWTFPAYTANWRKGEYLMPLPCRLSWVPCCRVGSVRGQGYSIF